MPMIRLARPSDLASLADIERSAAERFLDTHMAWAAGDGTVLAADLAQAQAAGLLWVAETADGAAAGFALTRPMDGDLYLAEMAVALPWQGRGLGRALLRAVCAHARAAGCYRSVVLTTDRDLPWNKPFYQRQGFTEVPAAALSPGLRARLHFEHAAGFDAARRCAMMYPLEP
ncbi:GNAT family N-acetyltransferase [Achromobacter insolitus]|uniref:GNAT family N-acetyltransferase n=1 Tax=Achromobacter insolitus TaxID=217204 RepID=UPI000AC5E280|nr:GNAT family N-acetyltransferase [Achromobacter insolitus]AVG38244.1 GNAT family N-acetyltransferase [Achromobacter insolitus]